MYPISLGTSYRGATSHIESYIKVRFGKEWNFKTTFTFPALSDFCVSVQKPYLIAKTYLAESSIQTFSFVIDAKFSALERASFKVLTVIRMCASFGTKADSFR